MKKFNWTRGCFAGLMGLLAVTLLCQTAVAQTAGTTNWAFAMTNNQPVFGTAAISPDGKTVYEGDYAGRLFALNATNGVLQWEIQLTTNGNRVMTPVLSRDGSKIYICTASAGGSKAFAVNSNGTLSATWILPGNSMSMALFERQLNAADTHPGYLFVGDQSGNVSCLAIDSPGSPLWTRVLGVNMNGSATIGPDGLVYVADETNRLVAFDMQGNTNYIWQMRPKEWAAKAHCSPSFGDVNGQSAVYVVNNDYQVYSFSLATHVTNWVSGPRFIAGFVNDGLYTSVALGPDGTVYSGISENIVDRRGVWGFNPVDGTTNVYCATPSVAAGGAMFSTPAIGSNGTVFAADRTQTFYAFNPKAGTFTNGYRIAETNVMWITPGPTFGYGSPTIGTDGTIYQGAWGEHKLYAFNNSELVASEQSFWPLRYQNTHNTSLAKPSAPMIDSVAIDAVDTLISWSSSPVAMEYLVYKNTTTNFSTATLLATNSWTNTAYTDAGEGASNYYWVRARNDSGLSSVGAWASATPPPTPTGVTASDGTYTDKVRVMWDAVSGPASYEVWRNTSSNFSSASQISSPALNELGLEDASATADATYSFRYDDTSATAGISYYYWVKAVNAVGNKSLSASDSGYRGVLGPLITANGLLGNVYLNVGDPVTLAIQMMNVDPSCTLAVDWWIIAFAHTGQWYYMNNLFQWTYFNGDLHSCHPVYQGRLVNLGPAPVLSGGILGAGTYTFWFAIDYPMNGILNGNMMLYDSVNVIVQ